MAPKAKIADQKVSKNTSDRSENLKDELNLLRKSLDPFYPIRSISGLTKRLVHHMNRLDEIVTAECENRGCRLADNLRKEDLRFLRKLYCNYETLLEADKAIEIIKGTYDSKACLREDKLISPTHTYATLEGKMAGIDDTTGVLIIGSGPFPVSAISYVKAFGCRVTCVEKIREFVNISQKLVNSLGLSGNIDIIEGLGQSIDASKFSKILVPILSEPKSEILRQLRHSNADIMIRTAFGSSRLVYEPVRTVDLVDFLINDVLIKPELVYVSTLLVKAKAS